MFYYNPVVSRAVGRMLRNTLSGLVGIRLDPANELRGQRAFVSKHTSMTQFSLELSVR
jgi:hypothetical protein